MDIEIKESSVKGEAKKYLGIQIPISMYEALQRRSEEEWLSVSDIVRKLIRDYLKEGDNN